MRIRKEQHGDIERISEITLAAFQHHPYSRQTEQFIILALRAAGALTLSLVAEDEGRVEGHIAFSPVTMTDGTAGWYGVGPLSVDTACQKRGIGSALMREGLAKMERMGAKGCALVGDAHFYSRFGFKNVPQLVHEGIPQEFFLILPFAGPVPAGTVHFHDAFWATS